MRFIYWKKIKTRIDWDFLSGNRAAIDLLKQNPEKINWYFLSTNPMAIDLLEKNQDNIDWGMLSGNLSAINLLEKNQDKIYWNYLSENSMIFKLDGPAMRKQMQPLAEELIAAVLHPRRVGRILEEHGYNIASDEYWDDC